MGLRSAILRRLATGTDERDPDEFIEFTVVKLAVGPLLVERLRHAGIDAHGHEAMSPAVGLSTDYRVYVRRRDVAAADRVYSD
ncbi:MAG: hypothetical protein RLZZ01_1288 [Actinomycetota bacterium]